MDHGHVLQVGSAEDLYERPANSFVASFVGRCNLLSGRVGSQGEFRLPGGLALPCQADAPAGDGLLAIRPERIEISPGGDGRGVPASLKALTYLGARTEYHVDLAGEPLVAVASTPLAADPRLALKPGDGVTVNWAADAGRIVSPDVTDGVHS